MKVYLKETVYFEVDVSDGSNRSLVTEMFSKEIRPQFENILKSIKFDDSDRFAFAKLSGTPVKIRLLSQRDFLLSTRSKKENLNGPSKE